MNRTKIIERIRKLLALGANNNSQEEAAQALLRVQALMVEHNVDVTELEAGQLSTEVKEVIAESGLRRLANWKSRLASVIAKNFRCDTYIHKSNPALKNKESERISWEREIIFVGLPIDAEICTEVFRQAVRHADLYCNWFLLQEKLELKRLLTRSESKNIGNTWRTGFVMGLMQKFEEQVAKNNWAMVLVTPEAVVQYMEETHGKLTKRQSSKANLERADALADGIFQGGEFGSEHQEKQEDSVDRGPRLLESSNA